MRLLFAMLCVSLMLTPPARGQETVALSAAVLVQASGATLRVARVEFNVLSGRIDVVLLPWSAGAFVLSAPVHAIYDSTTTPTGAALIVSLNKANLSTTSLEKRILNQLISSGLIAGTVSGTPP